MNISYLLNILNLYVSKEENDALVVEVHNNKNNVKIEFSYLSMYVNKTYVNLNKTEFLDNLDKILFKIQGNSLISNESYKDKKYKVMLDNKRQINFFDFTIEEFENIRSNFNNLKTIFIFQNISNNEPITYDEMYKETKRFVPKFSFGFSGFITIFLTAIWFLDIFMIALWIFKVIR